MRSTHIIVFAKAPLPGRVKTRLARAIGAQAAADLAGRMLAHTLEQAVAAELGSVELCGAPDAAEPLLIDAAQRAGAALTAQGEGDLGRRMQRAFERALQIHERVLMIGTDCPALTAQVLRDTAAELRAPRSAVFLPAHDGGYVLVGLREPAPTIFEGVAWSTPAVMATTRARLRAGGYEWWEGEARPDIDEESDLEHLPAFLRP